MGEDGQQHCLNDGRSLGCGPGASIIENFVRRAIGTKEGKHAVVCGLRFADRLRAATSARGTEGPLRAFYDGTDTTHLGRSDR